jgi:hypothetical protein
MNPDKPYNITRGDVKLADGRFVRITMGKQGDKAIIANIAAPKNQKTSVAEFRDAISTWLQQHPEVKTISGERISGLTKGKQRTLTRDQFLQRVNQDPRESMSPDEGFNSKEGDDILSNNEDIEVNDALPAKLPPPPAGYRRVKVVKPDGGSYEAFFNDKYYDMGTMGKFASIAKMTDGGLTHGATAKG